MLCAQVFLALCASNTKGVDSANAVSKTGHYYFAAFSSVTWVDLRAFSRSNKDWSSCGVAGMVLARSNQCDNSRRGADLITNWRFGRQRRGRRIASGCGRLALVVVLGRFRFVMGAYPKSEIRRRCCKELE